jgi:hypothetical protein
MAHTTNHFLALLYGRLTADGAHLQEEPTLALVEGGQLKLWKLFRRDGSTFKFVVIDRGEDGYELYTLAQTIFIDEDIALITRSNVPS